VTLGCAVLLLATRHRPEPARADNVVGDGACLGCHREHAAFESTAHRLTSRHPTRDAIAGSFAPGENVMRTANPSLTYRMDSTAAGFHQTAITGEPPATNEVSERIAYVVGSGRKGQTYVYRRDDRLFQLPVSYWTSLDRWVNSPGYLDGSMNFGRPVTPRCLECHSTWFETVADSQVSNRYGTTAPTLGITCEKCHGAGRDHVERVGSPLRVLGPAILNPARFSRTRQIESCAQCHGGVGETKAPSFSYVPGSPLARHLTLAAAPPNGEIDVHGNQVALLMRSACFRESRMTCATCHDVHREQRDPVALSAKCAACHQAQSHEPVADAGGALAGRCVGCHMPLQTSNAIISGHDGRVERPKVRTHWIRVYPDSATR
jgi:hypothetical protein